MTKPICIHAWLARDKTSSSSASTPGTLLCLTEPELIVGSYWSRDGDQIELPGHHGLRPGQIKRVVIVEDDADSD